MHKITHCIFTWIAGLLCGIAAMQLHTGEYLAIAAWALPLIGLCGVLLAIPERRQAG